MNLSVMRVPPQRPPAQPPIIRTSLKGYKGGEYQNITISAHDIKGGYQNITISSGYYHRVVY